MLSQPIVITGAAGLVGQNLIARLKARGHSAIVGIDKHPANTAILAKLHPEIKVIETDLAEPGSWADAFEGAGTLVLNHAQIGGLDEQVFIANNVTATKNVIAAAERFNVPHTVHVSSSVVNSKARDFYTQTKTAQEQLVTQSRLNATILRPTLMFGWFDRKHLGWLARFMKKAPVFPIPGDGRYTRQPLYAGDFTNVIMAIIEQPRPGECFNISGKTQIDYIDLIRAIKVALKARTPIITVPYALFDGMLRAYALVDKNPPFTTRQLEALVTPELFEVIDWPTLFGITATPLPSALTETFQNPVYSHITLEF